MSSLSLSQFLGTALAQSAVILSDLDGCLISGTDVLPGALDLMEAHGKRLWIVSNNSEDTAQTLADRLAILGLPVRPSRIFLAGEQALRLIAEGNQGARIALFAGPHLHDLARGLGLRPDIANPDLALLARSQAFTFSDLARLVALAHRGVPVWRTNCDGSHPSRDGTPQPETGALWAALNAAVTVEPAGDIGKPASYLLTRALRAANASPADAVFLGDRPETDGAAARAAAVRFVQVSHPGDPVQTASPVLPSVVGTGGK